MLTDINLVLRKHIDTVLFIVLYFIVITAIVAFPGLPNFARIIVATGGYGILVLIAFCNWWDSLKERRRIRHGTIPVIKVTNEDTPLREAGPSFLNIQSDIDEIA